MLILARLELHTSTICYESCSLTPFEQVEVALSHTIFFLSGEPLAEQEYVYV